MFKRILSLVAPEEESPIWLMAIIISGIFLGAGTMVYFYYFGTGLGRFEATAYDPRENSTPVRLEVGGTLFAVPINYTRNRHSRRAAVLDYIELHALLPALTPYQKINADEFLRTDVTSLLLLINVRKVRDKIPEQQFFNIVYQPYIIGSGEVRPDGLQSFSFTDQSPYADKQIFRALLTGTSEQRQTPPFFLCDKTDAPSPSCESRFPLGQTARVSYRFKRAYLKDWETLNAAVKELIRSFRVAARTMN